MERIRWQAHISIEPDLRHGEPCIRGTRIPVSIILGSLADGLTLVDIQQAYPQLGVEDIRAVLAYAAETLRFDALVPLSH